MKAATSPPRPERATAPTLRRLADRLGSLELALVVLAALAAAVLATLREWVPPTWALAGPLALLAVNVAAAACTRPVFRRNVPLLVFHLALVAIALLAALGRLTYLEGTAEVATGETFAGELVSSERGPWHPDALAGVRFVNEGFRVDYDEHGRRVHTLNAVRMLGSGGREVRLVIGDNRPLSIGGYHIGPTNNKGYAPAFDWIPDDRGPALRGHVHLPSYPANEHRQARSWSLGGEALWVMLQIDEPLLVPGQAARFRLPEHHRLIVRSGGQRHELLPGQTLQLAHGTLVYRGLGSWMGYTVRWDWTPPWLAAAALVGVLALSWHFLRKHGYLGSRASRARSDEPVEMLA